MDMKYADSSSSARFNKLYLYHQSFYGNDAGAIVYDKN